MLGPFLITLRDNGLFVSVNVGNDQPITRIVADDTPKPFPFDMSGQVWGHTPEQRVAASTLRRYSFGLAQADARPAMPVSFR